MTELTANGPLSRFRVLDLTRVRAGPTAVRQLADWGADVIKLEAPPNPTKAKAWAAPAMARISRIFTATSGA